MFFAAKVHVTITGQLLLGLAHEGVQAGFDVGQAFADVSHECCVESLCKESRAASGSNVAVSGVVLEKVHFVVESLLHGLVALNVLLGAVDYTDEAQLQGVYTARENIECVRSMVHKIKLGQDADGPAAQGIDMAGKLESFRVDNVDVGGGDGEDNAVGLGNVLGDEVTRLLLDVARLVANGNL